MSSELGGSQISSLLETLPGIANVLRSPVADALVGVMRAGAGLSEFRFDDADELIRYAVRRGLMNPDEGDRLLAELREVAGPPGKSAPVERGRAAPVARTSAPRPEPSKPAPPKPPTAKPGPAKPVARPVKAKPVKAAKPTRPKPSPKPSPKPARKGKPAKAARTVKPARPARGAKTGRPGRAVKSVRPVKKAAKTGRKR